MATSGTYAFNPTADDLLVEAWERCGFTSQVLNGEIARSARRSLQMMLDSWTNRGLNLWQVEAVPFSLVADQETFATAAATADVLEVTLRVAGSEVPLSPVGRDEWSALPRGSVRARPSVYWSERINPVPVLHFFPKPDGAYDGEYWRMRYAQDVGGLGNTIDAPRIWSEALAAGLAARLAVKFAPERLAMLKAEAAEAFGEASRENRERVPLTITPDRWS